MKPQKSDARKIVSINPATLKPVGEVPVVPHEAVQEIVQKGREAFPRWRDLGLKKRSRILRGVQQALLERNEDVATWITLEMGRPFVESLTLEVEAGVDLIGYYAGKSRRFLRDRGIPLHNPFFWRRKSYVHHQPLGVLGVIAPWNWPLLIPLGGIVPALLSGNTVVFKPSELTPLVGQKIGELFWEAGVPEAALQVIQGIGRVGEALVDSDVEKIFLREATKSGSASCRGRFCP